MSIEWLTAAEEPTAILQEGDQIYKQAEEVTGPLAILFGRDGDGAVIEGTATDLLAMLERARKFVLAAHA